MTRRHPSRLTLTAATLLLAAVACSNPFVQAPTPNTPAPLPTIPPSPTPALIDGAASPTVPPVPVVPLTTYSAAWYQTSYPVGWGVLPTALPDEMHFAPAGERVYGVLVRVMGLGYEPSVLDALLNNEVEQMGREGLAPQEFGLRRVEVLADGAITARSAEFSAALDGLPVTMRVTALVTSDSAAYVLRLWAPPDAYEGGYGAVFEDIAQAFSPVYPPLAPTPELTPTATPTQTPSFTVTPIPTYTLTPSPPPTSTATPAAPSLHSEPYTGSGYTIPYPEGWTPTVNLQGAVNILSPGPNLLVGIAVQPLGDEHDPDAGPSALLEAYVQDVAEANPETVIGTDRVEEALGEAAQGISTTYVQPYEGGRLVYRVTIIVTQEGGAAYRVLQWAPEMRYESGYRDLYRAVVSGFRPLPDSAS